MLLTRPFSPTQGERWMMSSSPTAMGMPSSRGRRPSEADLGTAEIAENCDGLAPPGGGFADIAEHLEMPIEIAVGEIESADIDARLEK